MKKMYRFLFAVAVAAAAFVGCVREPEMLPSADEHTVHFVAESIATRTAFGDPTGNNYPTLWTENDTKVKVALNMRSNQVRDAEVTPSADFKTATFSASFSADTTSWTFFAVSPASAYLNVADMAGGELRYRLGVTIPTTQTPSATSVDEAAQILIAQSSTTTGSTPPETVSFDFRHWTSYGKMSLTNLNLNGATIEAVDLTAEEDWAYRWYFYFADGVTEVNSGSKTITVNTSSASDIWFACAPVDLTGKKLTVTVKTNQGTFTKTVTIPGKFESGKIYRFSVNMAGVPLVAPKVYQKVTSIDDLTLNSEVIIAAASDATQYAISSTQSGNNRPAAAVIKADDKITDPGDAVAVFKVEAGASSGTFAFKATNGESNAQGYIYAASSETKSYLRTTNTATPDQKASWTVTVGAKTVMKAGLTGDNPRNILQFNPNNDSPIFNCYNSATSSRDSVAIYKLVVSGSTKPSPDLQIENETISVAVGESKEIGTSVSQAYTADGGEITYEFSDPTVARVEDDMVEGLKIGTCTITIKAKETTNFAPDSKTCVVTVTAGSYNIAGLMEEAQKPGKLNPSSSSGDILTNVNLGEVTVVAISGSNIIVRDNTGLLLVYKSGTNFAVGSVVTMSGKLQNYYGIAEFVPTTYQTVSEPSGPVDHGTATTFDESAITAYQSSLGIVYVKITGTLPASQSVDRVTVGSKSVRLYDKEEYKSDYNQEADIYGYAFGYDSNSDYLKLLNTSHELKSTSVILTVSPESIVWEANETDKRTVTVTVEQGGSWTWAATGMDWANIVKVGNTLEVTPNGTNSTSAAHAGSVTFTNQTRTATVTFSQKTNSVNTIASLIDMAERSGKLDNSSGKTDGTDDIAANLNLGEVTVVAVQGSNHIVKDATGLMLVFSSDAALALHNKVTMVGTLRNYYGIPELIPTSVTATGSVSSVDHGTPEVFDGAAITTYSTTRRVVYIKINGDLPTNTSGNQMVTVGDKQVRLYDTSEYPAEDRGKNADIYGYAFGYHNGGNYLQMLNTSHEINANAPILLVDATSKTWASSETNSFTVNVTVETGGSWTYTPTGMDWATITKSGNTLVVTPKGANTSSTPNEGSVTFINSANTSKTAVVSFMQKAAPSGGTPDPETITFKNLNLSNGVQYPDPFDGGNFTITFGGGGNDGKYYTTGEGIRTYGDGTITVKSESHTISSVLFVWSGASYSPTSDVSNPAGYSTATSTWTGSAKTIVLTRPSGTGHWRLQGVTVTYSD